MSLSSSALMIHFRNFRCTNCADVTVIFSTLTDSSMACWVGDLLCPFWLHVLWTGESTPSFILLGWSASQDELLGVSG